jgi:hypothetical protein
MITFAYAEIPESDLDIGVDAEVSIGDSEEEAGVLRALPVARGLNSGKYVI